MKSRIRMAIAVTAVGLVGGVAVTAAMLNAPGTRSWLLVCAVVATGMAVQAVTSEPRDLIPALVLALLPVVGLVSAESPSWLGLPFAALLLLAGELAALTWEDPARMHMDGSLSPRLREAGTLAILGLGFALVLGAFGTVELPGGTWAVSMGSLGLVGVAALVFYRPMDTPRGLGGSAAEGRENGAPRSSVPSSR